MAEEFALQKILWDGCTVDGEEGFICPIAVMVDGAGDEFLASAAVASDKSRSFSTCQLADGLENVLHGGAAADDAEVVVLTFQQRLVGNFLLHFARGFESASNNFLQLGDIKGFQ